MAARRTKKPPYGDVKAWIAAGYSEKTAKSEAYRKENYPETQTCFNVKPSQPEALEPYLKEERVVNRAKPDEETPTI